MGGVTLQTQVRGSGQGNAPDTGEEQGVGGATLQTQVRGREWTSRITVELIKLISTFPYSG